jgi:hypothetical protein
MHRPIFIITRGGVWRCLTLAAPQASERQRSRLEGLLAQLKGDPQDSRVFHRQMISS